MRQSVQSNLADALVENIAAWPKRLVEVATSVKSGAKLNFRIGYGSDANFMISATAF